MKNICFYKIKVNGTRNTCYALVKMIPVHNSKKEIIFRSGTRKKYTLIFTGSCYDNIDFNTTKQLGLEPFFDDENKNIEEGDFWKMPLENKSLVLNADIYCNTLNLKSPNKINYKHYKNGEIITDKCPEDIYIKEEDYIKKGE